MNINATLFGQFIFFFAIFMGIISYYLGKRKTETPLMASLIGFLSAIMPPLAIIYLIVLVCKRDVVTEQNNAAQ